jgi:phenylpropionate dioxygenase-like ring-hydroxylating dioxygenase large terminal subunit
MDDVIAVDVLERMEREGSRTGPPVRFPKLPDVPLSRYTDPVFYRAEMDKVFRGTWLFAGHESEWPAAGHYRTLPIPFAPVIVVRGQDGELRAFLNSCRHRGAPVVRDEGGSAQHLVCQFHSWSYDLTGCLVGVPEKRDFVDLDQTMRPLTRIRCEQWGGMVFISLNGEAPSLLNWLGSIDHVYRDLAHTPSLRKISTTTYEQNCNWKVLVDAFLEDYHVKTVHRDTLSSRLDIRRTVIDLHPHGHSGLHIPYRSGVGDGVWHTELPRMNVHDMYRTTVQSFSLFPNLIMGTETDTGFFFIQWWPLDLRRTRMDVTWYGVDWGEGPRPAEWDKKLFGSEMLMQEDLVNVEPIQLSLDAAAHDGIPLSYQERRLWHFHAEVDRMIGPDHIPVEQQVPDLLADFGKSGACTPG